MVYIWKYQQFAYLDCYNRTLALFSFSNLIINKKCIYRYYIFKQFNKDNLYNFFVVSKYLEKELNMNLFNFFLNNIKFDFILLLHCSFMQSNFRILLEKNYFERFNYGKFCWEVRMFVVLVWCSQISILMLLF
jgi:hypothetical protein